MAKEQDGNLIELKGKGWAAKIPTALIVTALMTCSAGLGLGVREIAAGKGEPVSVVAALEQKVLLQTEEQGKRWTDQTYRDREQDAKVDMQMPAIHKLDTDIAVVQQRLRDIDGKLTKQEETLLKILDRLPPR